jgi:hypothetical protein
MLPESSRLLRCESQTAVLLMNALAEAVQPSYHGK